MKVKDIGGEFELIKIINENSSIFSDDVMLGIGDDCAVIKSEKDRFMVLTTDMMVEEDHFSRRYFSPEQIGKKAIEVNVSDIASMGGIPSYALISIALPDDITLSFVKELYKGINEVCSKNKISLIGGDTTHSEKIVISVTMIGQVKKENLCLRKNARENDLICVTGSLGGSTAGLKLLLKEMNGESVKNHLEPKSRIDVSYIISKYSNCMEDVSDGLGQEVRNICFQSNKGAEIYKDKIPIKDYVFSDAKKLGNDAYDYALYGGEDFELVFTISEENLVKLREEFKGFSVVGKILSKDKGLMVISGDKKEEIKKGYDHFSS